MEQSVRSNPEVVSYNADMEDTGRATTIRIELTVSGELRKRILRGFADNEIVSRLAGEEYQCPKH